MASILIFRSLQMDAAVKLCKDPFITVSSSPHTHLHMKWQEWQNGAQQHAIFRHYSPSCRSSLWNQLVFSSSFKPSTARGEVWIFLFFHTLIWSTEKLTKKQPENKSSPLRLKLITKKMKLMNNQGWRTCKDVSDLLDLWILLCRWDKLPWRKLSQNCCYEIFKAMNYDWYPVRKCVTA